jgi:outer membrane usher protein FimD/PapC
VLGLAALPLLAHHSFAADYDAAKPITLHGTVTQVEWMNPHVRFYVDVKDGSGRVTNWRFELGSPNALMRSGWTRTSLKIGEEITVKGCRAKDNSNQGNATGILASDGKVLLSGVSGGQNLVAR